MPSVIDIIAIVPTVTANGSSVAQAFSGEVATGSIAGPGLADSMNTQADNDSVWGGQRDDLLTAADWASSHYWSNADTYIFGEV